MRNFEFFRTAADLQYAYDAFKRLVADAIQGGDKYLANNEHVKKEVEDPFAFGLKSADMALQRDLAPGTLVQIKTNISGEGEVLHYGVVVGPGGVRDGTSEYARCDNICIRFSDGRTFKFPVEKKVFTSLEDPEKMERDDIKLADIPPELVKLTACVNLDKCPLKKEGACLEN